jgi:MATE family multidrug resistance protein
VGTAFAGKLSTTDLASHTIVLHLASITFMIPLGLSSASSSRVGQSIGAGHWNEARYRGWLAFWLGFGQEKIQVNSF